MRTASPGPGNGWRSTRWAGSPSSRPSSRTSSLKSQRSGSTSLRCMRSGRPPTLWWVLITCAPQPRRGALDHVGIERALGEELDRPVLLRLLLEHRDELGADDLPLLLRDPSTPASRSRKRSRASTTVSWSPRFARPARARPPRPRPRAADRGRPARRRGACPPRDGRAWRRPCCPRRPRARTACGRPPTCARMSATALREEALHAPAALQPRDPEEEVLEHAPPVGRVHDLGMELDQVERAASRGAPPRTRSSTCARRVTQLGAAAPAPRRRGSSRRGSASARRANSGEWLVEHERRGAVLGALGLRQRPPSSCAVAWKP